jgi:hypothetical protein
MKPAWYDHQLIAMEHGMFFFLTGTLNFSKQATKEISQGFFHVNEMFSSSNNWKL